MRERRNKILVATLIGLTLVAVLLIWNGARDQSAVDKTIFKIDELSKIDQVVLQSVDKKVDLQFTGSRWRVNDTYDADEQMITVLFATLDQAEPRRPVAASRADSISASMHKTGVKVSVFEQGQLRNEFEVGGNPEKTEAYFQHNGQEPYVMMIPGYRVYVAGIFELGEEGWKDKRIFNFNWRNFKKLTARFKSDPHQNFEIEDKGDGFMIVGAAQTDTTKLNNYLDAVSLLVARQYLSEGYKGVYDSLLEEVTPSVSIEVTDVGNTTYSLELYEPLGADPDVLGKKNGKEGVLFGRDQIIPIVKTRDSFRKEHP